MTQTATQTAHQILPGNFIDQGVGAGAVFLVRSVFSYKEIACAPPGTHSLMRPVLELPAVALAHAQQDSASPSSSSEAGSSVADQSQQDKKFTPQIVKEEESPPVPDEVAIKELSHIATQAEVISVPSAVFKLPLAPHIHTETETPTAVASTTAPENLPGNDNLPASENITKVPISRNDAPSEFGAEEGNPFYL